MLLIILDRKVPTVGQIRVYLITWLLSLNHIEAATEQQRPRFLPARPPSAHRRRDDIYYETTENTCMYYHTSPCGICGRVSRSGQNICCVEYLKYHSVKRLHTLCLCADSKQKGNTHTLHTTRYLSPSCQRACVFRPSGVQDVG